MKLLFLLPVILGLAIPISQAAEMDPFFSGLPLNQVVEANGGIFVRLRETPKGKLQAIESQLIFKGSILAGYWFCKYSQQLNERLNVNLRGLDIVYSSKSNNFAEVVVFFKNQNPTCHIEKISSTKSQVDQNFEASMNQPALLKDSDSIPEDTGIKKANRSSFSVENDTEDIKVLISPEEF